MKIEELRNMNIEQLNHELHGLMREQFNLRMQKGSDRGPKPDQFQKVRRSIARIKTLINENATR